ncbi:MAG TPA: 23S rRNA (pseudouridine(1915)-N(3))-methyltransferase RlmH [Clostridia bacterium]|nr:23S rRNA (pseudouridine(1915)-N(3))-methyltransferase RlmH [Clostridia bacterium]
MNIRIVAVGRIKENFLRQEIGMYLGDIGRFCPVEIIEVADERAPQGLSSAEEKAIKAKEGQRILRGIRPNSYTIALAIEGQALSSRVFLGRLYDISLNIKTNIDFIIGGSLGLDEGILKRADFLLSFSRLTFPHQLMRLILLEQIYKGVSGKMGNPGYMDTGPRHR